MDDYVRAFIRASLVWLGVGVLIGLSMVFWPYRALAYRPAHVHANLLGFVSMMIFGVAYHVLPRFNGRGLYSPRLARAHLLVANSGLAFMVGGFIARVSWTTPGNVALAIGGAASAASAFMFIFNIWMTTAPRPSTIQLSVNK
jgi:cbb3-type cytochrome oxidase subunit 1